MRSRILLIIILSLLPFIIIFTTPLLPHTSDGGVQLPRMAAYFKALTDGHFPVRWAGDLNYGYGLPLFNFIYQFPFLITSLLIFLGFGLVSSFKIALAASFVFSGIFMYLFVRQWLGDEKKAMIVTLFYQFAPFRLVEILVRGALGGIFAYTFFPLVLYGIVTKSFAVTAIATALLVLSHNSLSLIFFGVSVVFSLYFARDKKFALLSLGYGLLLSAFFWLPALFEHKYTYGDLFMKDLYKMYFFPFQNFFIPNLTDAANLRIGEISVQLGLFHTIAMILTIIGLIKNKLDKKIRSILIFGLVLTGVAMFFMLPVSGLLWEKISFLRQFQFPWRFLAVTTFSTALMSLAWKKIPVIILVLMVASTLVYWYPRQGFDRVNEADFWNFPLNTTYFGETDVIWSAGPAKSYPASRVEFIEGMGIISDFQKKTQIHTFTVEASAPARLVDHTQYFPGWRVYVDNQKTPIEFQNQLYRGEITFAVPEGAHNIRVIFEESKIRFVANIVSLGAIVGLIIMAFL